MRNSFCIEKGIVSFRNHFLTIRVSALGANWCMESIDVNEFCWKIAETCIRCQWRFASSPLLPMTSTWSETKTGLKVPEESLWFASGESFAWMSLTKSCIYSKQSYIRMIQRSAISPLIRQRIPTKSNCPIFNVIEKPASAITPSCQTLLSYFVQFTRPTPSIIYCMIYTSYSIRDQTHNRIKEAKM